MTITISEPVTFIIAIVIGIGIKSLGDVALEWFLSRPRRFRVHGTYGNPSKQFSIR